MSVSINVLLFGGIQMATFRIKHIENRKILLQVNALPYFTYYM